MYKMPKSIESLVDECEWCGKRTTIARECEICGAVYCRRCAASPDEGGWDCPDKNCPGHPC
jgi:hypothetical protein